VVAIRQRAKGKEGKEGLSKIRFLKGGFGIKASNPESSTKAL